MIGGCTGGEQTERQGRWGDFLNPNKMLGVGGAVESSVLLTCCAWGRCGYNYDEPGQNGLRGVANDIAKRRAIASRDAARTWAVQSLLGSSLRKPTLWSIFNLASAVA